MHPEIFLLVKSSSCMSSFCLGVVGRGGGSAEPLVSAGIELLSPASTAAGSKNGACFSCRILSLLFSDRQRWKISKRKKSGNSILP